MKYTHFKYGDSLTPHTSTDIFNYKHTIAAITITMLGLFGAEGLMEESANADTNSDTDSEVSSASNISSSANSASSNSDQSSSNSSAASSASHGADHLPQGATLSDLYNNSNHSFDELYSNQSETKATTAVADSSANSDSQAMVYQPSDSFQKVIYLRGSGVDGNGSPIEHPYVVTGNNGDQLTLPNGESVKIANGQLVDPETNQPFSSDHFDTGALFTPTYKSETVQIRMKFEDLAGNVKPNKYNHFASDGSITVTQKVLGYDGEPFNFYYRDFIGNPSQYTGYDAQTINNQVDDQNNQYVVAILGQGLMHGNDPIILKPEINYAKINYFYYDNMRNRHDIPGSESTEGIYEDNIDVDTPFGKLPISQYFSVVPGQNTIYKGSTDPNNPQ